MGKFRAYEPGQAWLLPPSVEDVLGPDHLSLFIHRVVEQLDLSAIESSYSEEGQPGYDPRLLLKLWLYAYCLGVTSTRRLEQRTREDLGFRYLAGGATPDHWTLNDFRRRHGRALNDVFTQVVEWAQQQGLGRLGHVAIDSTRIRANASPQRVLSEKRLREERARIRRDIRQWQQQCNGEAAQEAPGTTIESQSWQDRLKEIPRQLRQLGKAGVEKQSLTDPDSSFLRTRKGFELGYTADIAVSEDHLIVAQRVTQNPNDTRSLEDLVDQVEQRCQESPQRVLADSGFYKNELVSAVEARGIDVYVPDSNMAQELHGGRNAEQSAGCVGAPGPVVARMRAKLRTPEGQSTYRKRAGLVEPLFGILKEQRNGRRFRLRGLDNVGFELCLMTLAWNLTRLHRLTR